MPVPIQSTNLTLTSTTLSRTELIYKEMMLSSQSQPPPPSTKTIMNEINNSTSSEKQSQIYFKNYIQESLRLLREKAKEHEANLREQIEPVKKLKVDNVIRQRTCLLKVILTVVNATIR